MIKKKILQKWCAGIGAVVLTGTGLIGAAWRMVSSGVTPSLAIVAAEMTMPTGQAVYQASSVVSQVEIPVVSEGAVSSVPSLTEESKPSAPVMAEVSGKEQTSSVSTVKTTDGFEASQVTEEELAAYDKAHEGEERYPVYEMTITEGNCGYDNVQVRNTASTDIDIAEES